MLKKIKYFFETLTVVLFFLIGKIIGLKLSKILFSSIFRTFGPLFKSQKIIDQNIKRFSKNISLDQSRKIQEQMWSNYGKTFIEYAFLNFYKNQNMHVAFENKEILERIKIDKKPVIFISGHFANFELMSMEINKYGINLATIYRPLNNIFLNPLMEYLRKKYVCNNQIKKGRPGVREAIQFLKKGFSVALMIDQRVSEGELVNFFSEKAFTTTLPAQLALKLNLKVIPVFIKREINEKFTIKFYDPVDSSKYTNKIILTEALNRKLEKMIIKNSGQWIWTHNRWK